MNNIDRAIVLDEAKAYSDRKGGYVESGKVLADIDLKTGNGFEKFADMPKIGRTYTIVLDSGTYSAKCKEIEGIEGVGYCGNLSILGGAIEGAVDTGESFLIFAVHNDEGDGMTSYTVIDKNEGAHCTVSTAETIVPIDQKFLPGVCLPVVELSTEIVKGATFTKSESEALTAAAEKKCGAIIRCTVSDSKIATTAVYSDEPGGERGFIINIPGLPISIKFTDTGWMVNDIG